MCFVLEPRILWVTSDSQGQGCSQGEGATTEKNLSLVKTHLTTDSKDTETRAWEADFNQWAGWYGKRNWCLYISTFFKL